MKKTFLKAVVATTVVATTMALSSVAAFAAKAEYTVTAASMGTSSTGYYYDLNDASGVATQVGEKGKNPVNSENRGFYYLRCNNACSIGDEDTAVEFADGKSYSRYVLNASDKKGALTFYADEGDIITVYYKVSTNNGKVGISQEVTTDYKVTNPLVEGEQYAPDFVNTLTYTAKESGIYYAGATNKRVKFFAVTTIPETDPVLTVTPKELSIKQGQSDTVTATIKNIDDDIVWSSSDNSVTVDGNNEGATITAAEDAEAGKEVTITAKAGALQETVTVTIVDKNEAEDYELTATGIPSTNLPISKHYGTKDMFVVEKGIKNSSNRIQVGKGAGIKFKAVTAGTLNIYGVASSNKNEDRTLCVTEDDVQIKTIDAFREGSENGKSDSGDITLKAGSTYYIDSTNNGINIDKITVNGILEQIPIVIPEIASTKTAIGKDFFAVDAANGNTYIIHAVTPEEMTKSSLALQGIGKTVAETDTVYASVEFTDGSSISATDLSAEAIYAVCVTGTDAIAPSKEFTWVTTD